MSDASDAATVNITLADYVGGDDARKLNIIGGGLTVIGLLPQPSTGMPGGTTAPFGVAVSVSVPPTLYGAEAALEVLLEDSAGVVVSVAQGEGEPAQVLRMGQTLTFEEPVFPGMNVPRGVIPARAQWVLWFGTGLPLPAGQGYQWRVRIDGDTRADWAEPFYVPLPQAGIVLG